MTEYMVGGRRRIDRVLAPGFAVGLDDLDLDELRARRAEAEQEETDLSYARRLLQGRLDILRAEREARENGEPGFGPGPGQSTDAQLAERLAKVLADGPRSTRGLGRHRSYEPTRVGENRREAYLKVNPSGQCPALELDDGTVIAEITAICEYVDEVKKDTPSLIGDTPEERAKTRMWTRRIDLNIVEPAANGFRFAEGLKMFENRVHCIPQAADDLKATADAEGRQLDDADALIAQAHWKAMWREWRLIRATGGAGAPSSVN